MWRYLQFNLNRSIAATTFDIESNLHGEIIELNEYIHTFSFINGVHSTLSPRPRTAVLPAKPRQMAQTMLDLPVPLAPTIMLRFGPGYTSV